MSVRSPRASAATLVETLLRRAEEQGEAPALTFLEDGERDERRLDFAGLAQEALAVAGRLGGRVAPGERVLLLHPPGLAFATAFLGCLAAGAVAVPCNPPRRNRSFERVRAIAGDCGARLALTSAEALGDLAQRAAAAPELAALEWMASGTGGAGSRALRLPRPGDVAFLQYTSGSTGAPKGVVVTHANLAANEESLRLALRHGPGSRIASWLPLFHDMGLVAMLLQALHCGIECVLMAPAHFLARPARWLEAIARHRATTSGGPDFAYDLCARRVTEAEKAALDLSCWTLAFDGAEPVRADTLARFAEAFAPCGFDPRAFYPGYGLAEATLVVSGAAAPREPLVAHLDGAELERGRARPVPAGTPRARALVGCGSTFPGHRAAIVDPHTRAALPERALGEIWFQGPSVAAGYWGRPEESERVFRARMAGAEGDGTWLRTGDLGFLDGGELFVAARLKDLVIVRGQNHHPSDLERTAEGAHPDLKPSGAAAFALEHAGAEAAGLVCELERRHGADGEAVCAAVRRALAREHELEPCVVALIAPGALPRTSSGKVQRAAARAALLAGELKPLHAWRAPERGETQAPAAPADRSAAALEAWLAARAAALLRCDPADVALDAPLLELGLDSLRAIELAQEVERAAGAELPLARLYSGATLRQLAAELAVAEPAAQPARAHGGGDAPLSHGQRALWFLQRLAPRSSAWHVAAALRTRETIDPTVLERALVALSARHAALRTTFAEDEHGAPRQRVRARLAPRLALEDARGWPLARVEERLAAAAREPLDLERGPPLRTLLLQRGDAGDVLLFCAHHLAVDHGSLPVLLEDLARGLAGQALRAEDASEPTPVELALREEAWLRSPRAQAAWSSLRARLESGPEALELPLDRPRSAAPGEEVHAVARTLDARATQRLRAFARERGLTPYLVCLAAFELALARAAGRERFALGTLDSGRGRAGAAAAVGYLVNPLVVHADLRGAPTFAALCARVRADAAAAFEHARLPFAWVVERLRPARDAARHPLFDALLAWQPSRALRGQDLTPLALGLPGARLALGPLALESLAAPLRAAQLDVALTLAELDAGGAPGLAAVLECRAGLYQAPTAAALLEAFERLLAAGLERPDASVALLAARPQPPRGAPPARAPQDVCARIARTALERPEAIAFEDPLLGAISYGDATARARRLAAWLRAQGVALEERIGVLAHPSASGALALLATLEAGAAYVPLDPEQPHARHAAILADAGARLCLVEPGVAHGDLGGARAVPLDAAERAAAELGPLVSLEPRAAHPQQLAYAIYTSGSTGAPKGVAVARGALAAHAEALVELCALAPADRVARIASPAFDPSLEELLPSLCAGATVVFGTRAQRTDLSRWAREARLTLLNLPTAHWHAWVEALDAGAADLPATLRLVVVGGERAAAAALRRFARAARGRVRWLNTYGPTEATITASWHDPRLQAGRAFDGDDVPIGGALAGWSLRVLDAELQPLPDGLSGELCIGGAGVARGYLGDPRRTAERFVPDPWGAPGARMFRSSDRVRALEGGELAFLGRMDQQVKLRGFRVEPGELAGALRALPQIADACARVHGRGADARLVAYAVPRRGARADPARLRAELAARLPRYLLPDAVVLLERLPLTPQGKVDLAALPAPATPAPGAAPAGLEPLARVWREVLRVERVSADDDFFALGGDSIASLALVARAARAGLALTPEDVFRHPTLAEQARIARPRAAPAARAAARELEVGAGEREAVAALLARLDGEGPA